MPATQNSAPSGQPKAPIKPARPGSLLQPSHIDRLAPANSTLHDVPASPTGQGTSEYFSNLSSHCSNKFYLTIRTDNNKVKRYDVFYSNDSHPFTSFSV